MYAGAAPYPEGGENLLPTLHFHAGRGCSHCGVKVSPAFALYQYLYVRSATAQEHWPAREGRINQLTDGQPRQGGSYHFMLRGKSVIRKC